jgi:hypothetical protein
MVSLILISWNTRDLLDASLNSVRSQLSEVGGECWVVDNNSADGSADMTAERHPWVNLVRNPANVGFARACNLVLPRCTQPYVFFFNPDATLDPGGLSALCAVMEQNPRLGGLMPRLLNADGGPTHFVGRAPRIMAARMLVQRLVIWRFSSSPRVQAWWKRCVEDYLAHSAISGGPYPRPQLEGAALMVRRAALDQVGLFDPGFFCGYEETDLSIRLRKAGWELGVTPLASVRHWDQQSRLQWESRPWEIADGFYFVLKQRGQAALLRHAKRERARLRHFAAAGLAVQEMAAEQDRVLAALLDCPEHPGYGAWSPA